DILVALGDPECAAASEHCRLSASIALHPVRMILEECMRGLVRIRSNAFKPGNIYERFVAHRVSGFRNLPDGREFLRRVQEALVAPRYIVIYFDPEHMGSLRFFNDRGDTLARQRMARDANITAPVLRRRLRRSFRGRPPAGKEKKRQRNKNRSDSHG